MILAMLRAGGRPFVPFSATEAMNVHHAYALSSRTDTNQFLRRWTALSRTALFSAVLLSAFAARVLGEYLSPRHPQSLTAYSGQLFRSRFFSRLWMRRLIAAVSSPLLLAMGCGLMRLPLLDSFARHVFFGRGSFPDLQPSPAPEPLGFT